MTSEAVIDHLISVSRFCNTYSALCSVHTVDFITEKKWELLPFQVKEELSRINPEQLLALLRPDYENVFSQIDSPALFQFVKDAKHHAIDAIAEILPQMPHDWKHVEKKQKTVPSSFLMSPKKSHEVEEMSSVIAALAAKYDLDVVVDFGNGKGYLSADLVLNHGLNVLGIESSESNCQAADLRNGKLISRFVLKKSPLTQIAKPAKEKNETCASSSCRGVYVGSTITVEESTDFHQLIENFISANDIQSITSGSEWRIMYSCLHACGNLFSCMLKQFVSMSEAKVLCGVGCCYHHIKEQFCEDPFTLNGSEQPVDYGFPLSTTLIKSKYCLGRNARMLASQSLSRITKNTLKNDPLFFRAVLQVILKDHVKRSQFDFRVGRLASKCVNFDDYVRKALKKLGLMHIELSEEEVNNYLVKYAEEERRFYAFQVLRLLMAPCLEALILLDRLVFLLEKEDIKEAYLTQMFDPVVSPRCYAVVAVKI